MQGVQRLMGCILPTMRCRSQHCWELLHPFAHHCQHACNNSQHCWRNNVGSCCVRLHAAWAESEKLWIKSWYSLSEKIVFYTAFRTNLRYCYVQKSSRKNKSVLVCIRLFTRNLSKSERHILDWNAFHFLLDLLNELVRGWLAWTLIHWAKQEI